MSNITSTYPPPPVYYKLNNLNPPAPLTSFTQFGQEDNLDFSRLLESKYKKTLEAHNLVEANLCLKQIIQENQSINTNLKDEMKFINHSILLNFYQLLDYTINNPQDSTVKTGFFI